MGKVIHLKKCDLCSGEGQISNSQLYNAQVYNVIGTCPRCKGRKVVRADRPKKVWGYPVYTRAERNSRPQP